jgi:hypothetical protein
MMNLLVLEGDQPDVRQILWGLGQGGIAMMIELDAIFASHLATTVFLYGSAAFLIASMAAVTWLCRPAATTMAWRTRTAS